MNFFDTEQGISQKGAVVSYQNVGFTVYNPPTCNYFKEQASSFWKKLAKLNEYNIPQIKRFGVRTKCFIPCGISFEEINNHIRSNFFSDQLSNTLGQPNDLQIVLDLKDLSYETRLTLGPMRPKEAKKYFSFSTKEFDQAGIYIYPFNLKVLDLSSESCH